MCIDLLSAFYKEAERNGIQFYYCGKLSQNVIATMGEALKLRLERQDAKGVISRKLFSSFIEIMQNAMHYSPDDPESTGYKSVSVAIGLQQEGKYFIICANLILKNDIPRIQQRLEQLKSMSPDEIRQAYRSQLKTDNPLDDDISKGAGLGFLTLARDSSSPIEYTFADINAQHDVSTFFIKITI